jgi:hypothetical protein
MALSLIMCAFNRSVLQSIESRARYYQHQLPGGFMLRDKGGLDDVSAEVGATQL